MTIPVLIPATPVAITDADTARAEAILEEFIQIVARGTSGGTPALQTPASLVPDGMNPTGLVPILFDTPAKQLLWRQFSLAIVRRASSSPFASGTEVGLTSLSSDPSDPLYPIALNAEEVSTTPTPNGVPRARADGTLDPDWLSGSVGEDLTALNAVDIGDPVAWSATADRFDKGAANTAAVARIFGISLAAIAAGASGRIVRRGIAPGVLVGATPGSPRYLGTNGGLITRPPRKGNRIVLCGYAKNATDLEVIIHDFGKK